MGIHSKKAYEIFDVTSGFDQVKFKENYLIFKMEKEFGKTRIKIDDDQSK